MQPIELTSAAKFVMPGLVVPGIHVLQPRSRKDVDGRDIGERKRRRPSDGYGRAEATPSFGRLCPAMTKKRIFFKLLEVSKGGLCLSPQAGRGDPSTRADSTQSHPALAC